MNRKPLTALVVLGLGAATVAAQAQTQPTLPFGASVGIYYPSDKIIQNAFGKNVVNYGISPVSSTRPTSGSLTPSLDLLNADANGNKLFIGTFTYGYEYHLGNDTGTTIPYVRGFGGASYFDYAIDQPGARIGAKRLGYTYGAEIGLVYAQRLKISARYNVYSKENVFSFNGITLNLTYSLFRL